jgi:hypothetical protein
MQTLGTWVAVATTALLLPACATQEGVDVDDLVEADNDQMIQAYSVDEIENMDLYDTGGRKIGEVQEVLAAPNGRLAAVEVEVDGAEVILPIEYIVVTKVEPAVVLRRSGRIELSRL